MNYSTTGIDLKELTKRIYQSKLRILSSSPFFGIIISRIQFFFNNSEKTISTDGKNIYLSPQYFSTLEDKEIDLLLLHEIIHIILKHPFRKKDTQKNSFLYDLACDIVVNSNIANAFGIDKKKLRIQGRILKTEINGLDGYKYNVDEVYSMLEKNHIKNILDSPDEEFEQIVNQEQIENEGADFSVISNYTGSIYFKKEEATRYINNYGWDFNFIDKVDQNSEELLTSEKLNYFNQEYKVEIKYLKETTSQFFPMYLRSNFINSTPQVNKSYIYYFVPYNLRLVKHKELVSGGKIGITSNQFLTDINKLEIDPYLEQEIRRFINESRLDINDINYPILMRNYIATYFKYCKRNSDVIVAGDEIINFLKYSKEGVCYHFASLYTLVMQLSGYKAKMIKGYLEQVKENKEQKFSYLHMHAWTEVYLENLGYVIIDPTPIIATYGNSFSNKQSLIDSHNKWTELKDKDFEEELDHQILDGIELSKNLNYGHLPAFAQVLLNSLTSSKLNWRELLIQFLSLDYTKDYNFTPPDYRFSDSDFILPGFNEEEIQDSIRNIVFLVDVSGSMSDKEINDCFSEIKGAISQLKNIQGYIGFFDAELKRLIPFNQDTDISKIKPYGRGGTCLNGVMEKIKERLKDELPSAIIILTDGGLEFPKVEYFENVPLLWIINNKEVDPPYGIVARI